ncbi:RecA-superfamily ATPases implicated in signal transduction (plasmid) [Euzebya pacifica]|uniref:RecA-superfamily ATPases implicated in signal transduction n=1 Tax=Euzebya pacifica TaxID=1608957 RepID=A0A346Y686_9ACTN|nr:RecA-superfamily ATPases implicated in signal transduction [Euzebya pacifica]
MPGHDAVPDVWAGRARELSDYTGYVRARRVNGVFERGRAVLGQPGIGKSVLVNRIAREASELGDIVLPPVRLHRGADPLAGVAAALVAAAESQDLAGRVSKAAMEVLRTIASLRIGDAAVAINAPAAESAPRAITTALTDLAGAARARGSVVLVRLDEVQNATADPVTLSSLLIALGDASAATVTDRDFAGNAHDHHLPVVVYLTGLLDFVDSVEGDPMQRAGATFGRRFAKTYLDWLADDEVRDALVPFTTSGWPTNDHRVTATADAIDALIEATAGDPFVFQLLGAAAWNARPDHSVINAADVAAAEATCAEEIEDHVARMLDPLPDLERAAFEVLVGLDPANRSTKAVADELGKTSSQLGPTMRRLERRRLVRREGRRTHVAARLVERHLP